MPQPNCFISLLTLQVEKQNKAVASIHICMCVNFSNRTEIKFHFCVSIWSKLQLPKTFFWSESAPYIKVLNKMMWILVLTDTVVTVIWSMWYLLGWALNIICYITSTRPQAVNLLKLLAGTLPHLLFECCPCYSDSIQYCVVISIPL